MNKGTYLISLVLSLFAGVVFIIASLFDVIGFYEILTFSINFFLIIFLMFLDRNNISLLKVIALFFMVFFIFVPIIQIRNDISFWGGENISDLNILYANVIIAVSLITMIFIHKVSFAKSRNSSVEHTYKLRNNSYLYALAVSVVVLVFISYIYGFSGLFTRTATLRISIPQSIQLIISNFIRVLPAAVLLVILSMNGLKTVFTVKYSPIFIIVFLLYFPLGGVPRYLIAAVYLSYLILVMDKDRKGLSFILFMVFLVMIVFPSINFFRYNGISDIGSFRLETSSFLTGDFDAYYMLLHSVKYVAEEGLIYGKNFLGALLFFVPRSIWAAKPIGTGAFVGTEYGFFFTNVSFPLIAEGFIALHFFGVVLVSSLLSIASKTLKVNLNHNNPKSKQFYALLLGFMFFILRGDLMSSFSYFVGFSLALLIANLLVVKE